jgi:RNA polymerase sigma factor (sigma-70 family)
MEFLRHIETLFRIGAAGGLTDGQLLERFLERRGEDAEAAFAALVDRHGAMVLRVCRQILRGEEDAEDAAQAAFLVLARRAGSISRRESVACWLHGVALRVAAKARAAATRRRAHELRGGEMRTAGHVVDAELEAVENHEDWATLHNELGSLPQSFRDPLILCYLDGLTQEQAAAQLRCPLGTIQSRLARGRAKLKTRLEKRGVGLFAVFAGATRVTLQSYPAPQAWAEATVRLALEFAQGRGRVIAGAGTTSVVLAEEVVRAIVLTKLKVAATVITVAFVSLSGGAGWAMRGLKANAPVVSTDPVLPPAKVRQQVVQPQAPVEPEWVTRTVRGIVRDEQGRPVAKAWVGSRIAPRPDRWDVVEPLDGIRERVEPFRDGQGKIVPAGAVGKYLELKDKDGTWHPLHPTDVRRYEKAAPITGLTAQPAHRMEHPAEILAAIEQGKDVFEVCKARGRLVMSSFGGGGNPADRTDDLGNFLIETNLSSQAGKAICIASADFSHEALVVLHADDSDRPVEVTITPLRHVQARVIVKSSVPTLADLSWDLFTVDSTAGKLDWAPGIEANGELWNRGWLSGPDTIDAGVKIWRLELRVPRGRYKAVFSSEVLRNVVDIVVPAGNGPLELPDITLKTSAWFRMLGKPAAEIDAVDLDGKPANLAEYRGKVVSLVFYSTNHPPQFQLVARLPELQKRFKGQPLAVLALHDATLTTLNKALEPLREKGAGEVPIRLLFDRASIARRPRRDSLDAVEDGSGRTADLYGNWDCSPGTTTYVIDKNGKLVFASGWSYDGLITTFAVDKGGEISRHDISLGQISDDNVYTEQMLGSLVVAIEDRLGLPRSPLPKLPPVVETKEPTVFKGKVVDLDGKPISGAMVTTKRDFVWKEAVRTGPGGEFNITEPEPTSFIDLKVDAPGLAARCFSLCVVGKGDPYQPGRHLPIDPSGVLIEPLQLGPGVEVTGRVLQGGKPVGGVLIGLTGLKSNPYPLRYLDTKTDELGRFHILHVLPGHELWVCATIGSIADGGTINPIPLQTEGDGSTLDVGELRIEKGRTLAGRLACSDGKAVPEEVVLLAGCPHAGGGLERKPEPSGRFEFKGLPDGPVELYVFGLERARGSRYRVSAKNRCLDPHSTVLYGRLDRDITDLTILLEPGVQSERRAGRDEVDPAVEADFNDAQAGPIMGVPPRP